MDVIYNSFKRNALLGSINLSADTIMCGLVTSAYTPDVSAHSYYSDITNEVTGVGYTTSGVALSAKTITISTSLSATIFDAADVSWPSSTISAAGTFLYKDTGNSATSPLIAYIGFVGGTQVSNLSTFQALWNSNGIFKLGQT
jgi:hypothetical protein